jgi:hypothetical protein
VERLPREGVGKKERRVWKVEVRCKIVPGERKEKQV